MVIMHFIQIENQSHKIIFFIKFIINRTNYILLYVIIVSKIQYQVGDDSHLIYIEL